MKITGTFIVGLMLSAGSALALPPEEGAKTCEVFRDEFVKFVATQTGGDPSKLRSAALRSPLAELVRNDLDELEPPAIRRIYEPLHERFSEFCLAGRYHAPDQITVAEAYDLALDSLKLDRSLPHWGLPELPDIDYDTQSCLAIVEATADMPAEIRFSPVNDTFVIAVSHYVEAYDLETVDAFLLAGGVQQAVALKAPLERTIPCKTLFDQVAEEHGLPRKP